ncbi:MAG TPA: transketolase [Thermodesulfobacteriota bacterium]|nr:transketolase [Thermodesulfobacteriota bacterium]
MKKLDELCINTIRMLSVDMVQQANSGHPGMPMGAAPMAYVLWTEFLKHHPKNPKWPDRDRFVLSAGHGSALLYSLLHLTGYDLSMEELKRFRQWGSKTPGHPEYGLTPGVEATSGPLGQGFGNGVGMAIAERFLSTRFNRPEYEIVNHYIYAIVSDGDLMEGVASEAASLAGHLKLGKLIYLYDNNAITLAGETKLTFTEDVGQRFEGYGWHVQGIDDGNDVEAISKAISAARNETSRPSLISIRTHIGYGSPRKQDTFEAHGSPLGPDEVIATKKNLGWPLEPTFYVPEEALARFRKAVPQGAQLEERWNANLESYGKAFPGLRKEWDQWMSSVLPEGWDKDIPVFPPDPKGLATRAAGGQVMNAIASHLGCLIGGSADLNPSTNTALKGKGDFQPAGTGNETTQGAVSGSWGYEGANIAFGVREHGMGGIVSGMALHGGLLPYGSTFFVFSDYMRPAIRLAALMKLHVIYIFTHDSIAVGEDGPTHEPVEQLFSLRVIPGLTVIRPADANEVAEAWRIAVENRNGPTAIILTRQNIPVMDRGKFSPAIGLRKGAYILSDPPAGKSDVILIATGSEVHLAVEAQEKLLAEGVKARVVSMPSWELFNQQPENYRHEVLPPDIPQRVSIEAGATLGWHRYVGKEGEIIGIDHFGASAPGSVVQKEFGFTSANIVNRVKTLLARKKGK